MANEPVTTIVGNLTADPELKYTGKGLATCRITIANNQRVKGEDGQWRDGETAFVAATAWRDYAENIAEHLRKGDHVMAYGRLKWRTWTNKNGEPRGAWELHIEQIGKTLQFAKKSAPNNAATNPTNAAADAWGGAPF